MALILKSLVDSVAQWKDVSPYNKSLVAPANVLNQPAIYSTSPWGTQQYNFTGLADPVTQYMNIADTWFRTIGGVPVTAGTLMVWFTPDTFTTEMFLAGSYTGGADTDEFWLGMDGTVANDPMEIVLRVAGVTTYRGRFAAALTNLDKNCAAITSDGTTLRAYFNGNPVAITDVVGANAGQWFASAAAATHFGVATTARVTTLLPYDGQMALVVMYNTCQPGGEIKRTWEAGYGVAGPRYLPKD